MGREAAICPLELSHHSQNGHQGNSVLHGLRHYAMIPTEVRVPSFRYENFDEETNTSLLAMEKDMIEERREVARVRMEAQKQLMVRYYDSRVKALLHKSQ